jgi:signal peptidase I
MGERFTPPPVKVGRNLTRAALMSFMVAGLGQLYNGQLGRAIFFLVPEVAMIFVSYVLLPTTFAAMLVMFLAILLWRLASVVDAIREGHRLGAIVLKPFNSLPAYIAVALAVFVYQEALRTYKNEESFRISGPSSLPTLLPGDYVMGSGHAPIALERGQLVAFRHPTTHETFHVMRVVGVPGDTVQIREGKPHINGRPASHMPLEDYVPPAHVGAATAFRQMLETLPNGRSYRTIHRNTGGRLRDTEPVTVPEGHYFVLGDNRDDALDSRTPMIGLVPADHIVHKLDYVWWSNEFSRVGIRLD